MISLQPFEYDVTRRKSKWFDLNILNILLYHKPQVEILDDDHYQLVVDQQVNEQHLLLLLLVPFQRNKLPVKIKQ